MMILALLVIVLEKLSFVPTMMFAPLTSVMKPLDCVTSLTTLNLAMMETLALWMTLVSMDNVLVLPRCVLLTMSAWILFAT
jgi:hypothetical protein